MWLGSTSLVVEAEIVRRLVGSSADEDVEVAARSWGTDRLDNVVGSTKVAVVEVVGVEEDKRLDSL